MSGAFEGRFDHAVIVVADLDAASRSFARLGFTVSPGGVHTGRGTHNALVRFGVDYLELLAVRDRAEAQSAGSVNAPLLERLRAGETGLASFALATTNIERDAARLQARGLSAVGPFPMERKRADGRRLSWRLLVPEGDPWGKAWPFFIEWDQDDATRLSWERASEHANGASRVVAVSVGVTDASAARVLYAETLGLSEVPGGDGQGARHPAFATNGCEVRLYPPGGPAWREGIFEVTLAARDVAAAEAHVRGAGVTGVQLSFAPA